MTKGGCKCFMCRHKDEPRLIKAYLVGFMEASQWFLNWAKENGIKMGSITDKDLGGLYACMDWNYNEAGELSECFPNIEKEDK